YDGWNTRLLFPLDSYTGPRQPLENDGGLPGYFREGFLTIQHAINREIICSSMNDSMIEQFKKINVTLKRFPFPSYVQDPFISVLENNLSLMIMLSFLCTCIFIIRSVVQEKEKKLKEYMCIMGLSNWLHWTAWFFMYFIIFTFIILIMITLFFLKVNNNVAVLTKSDPSLVFLFLICFAISTISFSFMISVFFSKANVAVAAGAIVYFFSYIPFLYIEYHYFEMSHAMKLTSCLLSNVAMSLGIMLIIVYEARGSGIQWQHVLRISMHDRLTFVEVMAMLLFDSVLYSLVTWYVEATFPGKYGVPQPWNFFIMPSYWLGKPHIHKEEPSEPVYTSLINPYVQDEPLDLLAGVKILNLCKVFRMGNNIKRAVKNLTLNMYEGQITVLLGHNGAGKTTTLSILTGLFPPTSGEAWIGGYEISENMVQIRKSLGLCPQHDILFDHMTVAEHLTFYVQIKGSWDADFSDEINNILTILGLEKKRHTISRSLSGGMRRKLSIGISLIGGSKVVMMDEPTSGMDPVSRRAMWDLLQQEKSKRTIVLTTHFMDEADLLGDRIAILAKGKLQCCGSSLFLKQKYGAGYHMTIVKKQYCLVEEIERLIYEHIPSATMESNIGAELSFIMPKDNISRFEALFEELEGRKEELGISSFGASVTTMEEVFLRVSKFIDSSMDLQNINRITSQSQSMERKDINLSTSDLFHENIHYNKAFTLGCQQFYAMLMKKISFTWCHWRLMLIQIFAILVCLTLTIKAYKINLESSKTPFLQMKLNVYGETIVPFFISNNTRLHPKLSDYVSDAIKAEEQLPMKISYSMDDFLIYQATQDRATFDENFLVAISFQDHENKTIVTALFNNQAYHAAPMALAMVDNILYKLFFDHRASITITNNPQPPPKDRNYVPQEDIYAWESLGIGMYLTSMTVCGFIYLGLLFCIDTDFLWRMKTHFFKTFDKKQLLQESEESVYFSKDQDVEDEKNKIRNFLPALLPTIPLIALEITKVYGHKKKKSVLAVDKISLAIKKGECFGLLGLNGAGKTTTFRILTGETTITSGDAFINGRSISSHHKEIKKQIGYCPQFDSLLGHMTGRQLLIMYARLWGIPEVQIQSYVKDIIFNLLLETHADKCIKDYSGGNKRKLSAGVALLGKPIVIFLDEPSTGMDPVARRLLWNQVTRAREAGKAIVITSHSMEECEALCTRLAIMVNGRFKCLGSPQHLKSKYGSGYTLLAKIKSTSPKERDLAIQEFKIFVQTKFPGSRLKDEHQGMVHYHLPKENLTWSKVFGILENAKNTYKLDDYSISQVSLEQIFLSFAHLQVPLYDL
ncbi:phospholipid-transporting ATPase ABCA3-like, partial [Gracilinanus agilis]|uniref:phospholipid-transporting ATPase ABCA3-like n=1 Tax=Gracilinanus agilis TaxID=191870 RepID=UPI001CFDB6D3